MPSTILISLPRGLTLLSLLSIADGTYAQRTWIQIIYHAWHNFWHNLCYYDLFTKSNISIGCQLNCEYCCSCYSWCIAASMKLLQIIYVNSCLHIGRLDHWGLSLSCCLLCLSVGWKYMANELLVLLYHGNGIICHYLLDNQQQSHCSRPI